MELKEKQDIELKQKKEIDLKIQEIEQKKIGIGIKTKTRN